MTSPVNLSLPTTAVVLELEDIARAATMRFNVVTRAAAQCVIRTPLAN
eukprot:CAMPEP_0179015446 /NCGR_PEP_ID=MMETSP0796-20121207/2794_1 /TAXON_ID=73915 /ORGANISM="Pyrodinium bahamense, Strain pbaha01" /LENGTH=47 /DNA_ID= /DNA_START= /DNA_END= /DNA_ORIENTATION=